MSLHASFWALVVINTALGVFNLVLALFSWRLIVSLRRANAQAQDSKRHYGQALSELHEVITGVPALLRAIGDEAAPKA